nr:CHAT domain-containing protein [Acidobacteriota bacterium]
VMLGPGAAQEAPRAVPPRTAPAPAPVGTLLRVGEPIAGDLRGGAVRYSLPLRKGDYLRAAVNQDGVDVAVVLIDPRGREVVSVDSPTGDQGMETLEALAELAGEYQLEVRLAKSDAGSGSYQISLHEVRQASGRDRVRVRAAAELAAGDALRHQHRYREALPRYQQAIHLWWQLGDRGWEQRSFFRMGCADQSLAHYQDAFDSYLKSLPVFAGGREEAWVLTQIGQVDWLLGKPWLSERLLRKALINFQRHRNVKGALAAQGSLARHQRAQGHFQEALETFKDSARTWGELGDSCEAGRAWSEVGETYGAMNQPELALQALEKALELEKVAKSCTAQASTLNSLADVYTQRGDLGGALRSLQEALKLSESQSPAVRSAALLRIGVFYFDQSRDLEKAKDAIEQALAIAREGQDRPGEAYASANLGHTYHLLGQKEKGLELYDKALVELRKLDLPEALVKAQHGRALVLHDLGRLPDAVEAVEEALLLVEQTRGRPGRSDLRASYFADKHKLYELQIDLLMELAWRFADQTYAERAFSVSERARARLFLEGIAGAGLDLRAKVPATQVAREDRLLGELESLEERRSKLGDLTPASRLPRMEVDEKLQGLRSELDKVRTEMERSNPLYSVLSRVKPIGVEEVQRRLLDRDTVLLSFALGEERSWAWVIGESSFKSYKLEGRQIIEDLARRAAGLLGEAESTATGHERDDALWELSQKLLAPLAGELDGKRLLIVADGALQTIPFAVLPDPRFRARRLVTDHEIVYQPSASSLALLRRELEGRPRPPKALAILADAVYERSDPRVRNPAAAGPLAGCPDTISTSSAGAVQSGRTRGPSQLHRLRFACSEAQDILAHFPQGQTLAAVGFAASVKTAKGTGLKMHRIIQFDTHAILNQNDPEQSALVLSQLDERGRPEDGLLRVHDIYRLLLPVDLVVLSACRTGLGKEIKGEGMVGLTRAFFHAGAARVLVSLWNVDDRATAELMRRFYAEMLRGGRSPAAALRAAQVSMMHESGWQDPYYWAGFVLQGEWR